MDMPPNLAALLTHCGQLLLGKISKFDATRSQILRLKCTKFDFCCGFAPNPAPLGELRARGGEEGGKGKGRGMEEEEREGRGGTTTTPAPQIFWPRTAPGVR